MVRTIRNNGREGLSLELFEEKSREKLNLGMKDAYVSGGSAFVAQVLELSLQTLVLSYGGLAVGSDLTIGGLVTFQMYWNILSTGFQSIFDQIGEFSKAHGAAQRVLSILENLPVVDMDSGHAIGSMRSIELRDVCFRYKTRPEKLVLNNVSFTLERGKVVALVGKSGGGKSTIVQMLCAAYVPESGCIFVDGTDLRDLRQRDYRSLIGVVEQVCFVLFCFVLFCFFFCFVLFCFVFFSVFFFFFCFVLFCFVWFVFVFFFFV